MPLNGFTPNTKIESAKVNSNFNNLSNHARWITLQWIFSGSLVVGASKDIKDLPDDVTWERADLIVDTAPTGDDIIVDIERSTDGGSTWVTIFTTQSNRPEIAATQKQGNTTTIEVDNGTANSHRYRAVIDQIGSTVPGADLIVTLKGTYDLD